MTTRVIEADRRAELRVLATANDEVWLAGREALLLLDVYEAVIEITGRCLTPVQPRGARDAEA